MVYHHSLVRTSKSGSRTLSQDVSWAAASRASGAGLGGAHPLPLRAWWNAGGRAWVASYLDPDARATVLPPLLRDEATPPAGLRCPADDAACGAEDAPWLAAQDAVLLRAAAA